ncbi:hypothetical protein [Methylocystis parvus]|uniref:hypothetical protein n=1 Tax=Methylocystis parvus TaxID=134 RepID=UPI003C708F7F
MFGGSTSDAWNNVLINQIAKAQWTNYADEGFRQQLIQGCFEGLAAIGPKDELEGMIAVQLIAAHSATMECFRRAMLQEQTFEGRRESLNQANKLSRTYATLLEALNRHRGKGQQKVTVEHVHVHAGGRAVVGVVEPGGGAAAKIEGQPHAKQIGDAPFPALRGKDTDGECLPVTGDDERALPNARGEIARRAQRK